MTPIAGEQLPSIVNSAWDVLQSALAAVAVEITRESEVCAYLNLHPDMYEVTAELCHAARQEFGPESSLTLQIYRDPEIEDRYLALYVRLKAYDANILPRLRSVADAFDQ